MKELNRLILADCMSIMKEIPDKYFELAIVDPPYGLDCKNGFNRATRYSLKGKTINWDTNIPDNNYFNELFRVSQNQIIWGGNYYLETLGNCRCFLIWDKLNPERDFADGELAWTSFNKVTRIWQGRPQDLNRKDGGKIHPTQKPVDLYRWLLKNYAKPGDKILDTHAGSCSSVIACLDMGFEYLAIEKDEEYFVKAMKRIEDYKAQTNLFKEHLNTL